MHWATDEDEEEEQLSLPRPWARSSGGPPASRAEDAHVDRVEWSKLHEHDARGRDIIRGGSAVTAVLAPPLPNQPHALFPPTSRRPAARLRKTRASSARASSGSAREWPSLRSGGELPSRACLCFSVSGVSHASGVEEPMVSAQYSAIGTPSKASIDEAGDK